MYQILCILKKERELGYRQAISYIEKTVSPIDPCSMCRMVYSYRQQYNIIFDM